MLQNQITFLQVAEDSLCTWLLVLPFVFPGLRERRGKCKTTTIERLRNAGFLFALQERKKRAVKGDYGKAKGITFKWSLCKKIKSKIF